MGTARADYRLIGFGVVALVVVLLIGNDLVFGPKTPFEREQARAEAANPQWVEVEITTADHRNEYRESESIYIVPRFSSTKLDTYKIEIAEGESLSTIDTLHISNNQKVSNNDGIFCCFSRLVGLDHEPYSPRRSRPLKLPPGRYEIYLTTRRVFTWDTPTPEYESSKFEAASNLLKIRVIPDPR